MNKNYNDDPFANPGEPKRGQCVLHRNVWFKPDDFPAREIGEELRVFGVNQKALDEICSRMRSKSLFIKGMTADDLGPLASLKNLTALNITWAHKFMDVSPLATMKNLQSLTLSDTKRWQDLSQLMKSKVKELNISGGMWNDNVFETLEPLPALQNLRTLHMSGVKIKDGGLKPLARCRALKVLNIAYNFDTEDYAYLAVHLPNTKCDAFAGIVNLNNYDGKDRLVVGKRKPFLSSKKDKARLEKYRLAFEALKEKFRFAEP